MVAARDLPPGSNCSATDVRLENRTATTVPDGALTDVAERSAATLAGPARRGEALTDVRLLGPRLAECPTAGQVRASCRCTSTTPRSSISSVPAMWSTCSPPSAGPAAEVEPQVVATDAVVVLVSEERSGAGSSGDRVVLVALPAHAANAVAGATLVQTVTLTFH